MRTIIHVNTERSWRGGERQLWELHVGLRARGVKSLVCARPGTRLAELAGDDLALAMAPTSDLAFASGFRLARWITGRGGDVLVHAHTARAHAVALLARRTFGATMRLVVSRRVDLPPKNLEKYRSASVDRYLAVSNAVAGVLVAAGVSRERIAVVRDAVGLDRFPRERRAEIRALLGAELGLPAHALWCVTAARFSSEKGHRDWIDALPRVTAAVPHAYFLFAGDGEELAHCRARVHALGLDAQVRFLGFRDDVEQLLVGADLLVVPSLREGLCSVVLEAQAAGVPVLATRTGGIPEIVEDGRTGRLCAPGSPAELSAVAIQLLCAPEQRAELADRGLDAVRARDRRALVAETLAVYDAVLPPREESSQSLA